MGTEPTSSCWCGERSAAAIGADYLECSACGTLRFDGPVALGHYGEVDGDEVGFYGAGYWLERVPEVHGNPTLEERAVADLCERAPYQLQRVLEWCAPRGRLLELGCAPGALTSLLRQAGFDAVGLEISPQVVSWVERRFSVPVLRGPLERLEDEGGWSAIVAVDVLEHLPQPQATLRLCRSRLRDDGLLFLQTPCYRGEGEGWEMLLPEEHLFLFNESSVGQLLAGAGFDVIEVGPSLFPYDMWVTASRGSTPQRREACEGLSPLLAALVGLASQHRQLQRELASIDRDRRDRLEAIERLTGELSAVESDRQAKDDLIAQWAAECEELRADQAAQEELLARHAGELAAVDADRRAKDEVVARLAADVEALRVDQEAKQRLLEVVDRELAEVRRDQSAKEELIQRLSGDLSARETAAEHKAGELSDLREQLAVAKRELSDERAHSARLEVQLRRTPWNRFRRWLSRRS